MSPELLSFLQIAIPSVGGVIIAWLNYRNQMDHRRALERAKAAGQTDLMEALDDQVQPNKLPPSGAMVLCLLALTQGVFGVADAGTDGAMAKARPVSARQCYTAADCDDGQKCERGRCIATAKRPQSGPRPSFAEEDAVPWALWQMPRAEQSDPMLPRFEIRDVLLTRRRRL